MTYLIITPEYIITNERYREMDIILVKYIDRYQIIKNRYGVNHQSIPKDLLNDFLNKPDGKLKTIWE